MQSIQCVLSECQVLCKTDHKLRDPEAFCMSLRVGPDLRWACDVTSRAAYDELQKDFTAMSACICDMGCFGGKETATVIPSLSEDREHGSVFLTEAVCLCLYMWPIVVCSNELWYEVLCLINLLIRCPLCATRLNPVHWNSCFRALKLVQCLKRLIIISPVGLCLCCVCQGRREG